MSDKLILAINTGSTSTKIAVYRGAKSVFAANLTHTADDLQGHMEFTAQYEFRKKVIMDELARAGISVGDIALVMGRGGLLNPIRSGVYAVNDLMKEHLRQGWEKSKHGANLAALIADEMARSVPGARAFIADPPVVDELDDVARITGHPAFERKSIFHALNQKAIAKKYARDSGVAYESLNLIVAHLGGGVSVGAHRKGLIVDVNNALDGDGPFSPERAGALPPGDLAKLCFSGTKTQDDIRRMMVGGGGIVAHLGTNDARIVEKRIAGGDEKAKLVYEAMLYQVAKHIGAMFTVLMGEVDAIIITGGIAYSEMATGYIRGRVEKLAKVCVYPGEDEMEALAMNGLQALSGETEILEYR
jgi:butyrate kinase